MLFWISMSISNFIIPIIMLVFGLVSKKIAHSKINTVYGYRTKRSMMNHETWEFAQKYCGKLWIKIAIILIFISIIVMILTFNKSEKTIAVITVIYELLQCVLIIYSIIPIEKALKENFGEDENNK